MVFDPNIPQSSNIGLEDIDKIRENFQELESSRIVESGSNSDGYWTRWDDGTQMCYTEFILDSDSDGSQDYDSVKPFNGQGGHRAGVVTMRQGVAGYSDFCAFYGVTFYRANDEEEFRFRSDEPIGRGDTEACAIEYGRWK